MPQFGGLPVARYSKMIQILTASESAPYSKLLGNRVGVIFSCKLGSAAGSVLKNDPDSHRDSRTFGRFFAIIQVWIPGQGFVHCFVTIEMDQ